VVGGDGEFTTIALDAGFASHSHFTARFRALFGVPAAELRRSASKARRPARART
jgi:transcriptional regulator GlxA family with amidase domain